MRGKGGYWLIGQVRSLPAERGGVSSAETDAKPMRSPVVGERDTRIALEKDAIELH